ncbi:MAG: cysteine desulfurase [Chloroflexi bacterium HGW-Chloroflexi-10]|nr:MAG: cysteine desulfurase [Chloroflexi bacterium HGW-Chloroflexi-10]
MGFDINKIRGDFPILNREVKPGIPLVYLDSTATSQKPDIVIRAMDDYYQKNNANIHRGVHTLAEEATAMYEKAREKIARFIHARSAKEVIYTRNTTESINLVAFTWGRQNLREGDVIVLTEMEHHSNLVPWQMLATEKNLKLEFIEVNEDGSLDLEGYQNLLKLNPKLVAFTHMSNVLGTINPAKEMVRQAHAVGAITLIDGAQSVPHFSVDVQNLDADFYAFSAHKMCGPTGIGVLYGKEKLLAAMPPFLGGGDMIKKVQLRTFKPNDLPHKFEAGTPAIAEAVGFGAAVDYLSDIGMDVIARHEQEITEYALSEFAEVEHLKIFGNGTHERGGVLSFELGIVHPHDVAQILDSHGVAVRAGHHCAMPLHEKFHIPATTRASFYLYTEKKDIDRLVVGLHAVNDMFA